MARKFWVYVAGPYTGAMVTNIRNAVMLGHALRDVDARIVPFVPHTSHLSDLVDPHPYQYWLDLDFDYLERCDALLRLEGASPGADREVELAHKLGIPVFHSEADLFEFVKAYFCDPSQAKLPF